MSLGKQITIGRLNTEIVDGLMRNKHLRKLLLTSFITTLLAELDFSDDDDDESPIERLQQLLLCPTLTADVYPALQESILFKNIFYFLHNEENRIFICYKKNDEDKKVFLDYLAIEELIDFLMENNINEVTVEKNEDCKQYVSLIESILEKIKTDDFKDCYAKTIEHAQ